MAIVRILPLGVAPRRRDAELFDGVMPRSFMAPTLKAALNQLTGESATSRSLSLVQPNIRLGTLAAIEDTVTQALGSAVVVKDAPIGGVPQGVEARCAITLNHAQLGALQLSVLVSPRSATVLTGRFKQVDPELLPPEEATTGLAGTAALIAERVAAGLTSAGLEALADPGVSLEPSDLTADRRANANGHAMALQVRTRPAGLSFRITIRGVAAAA